MKRKNIEIEDAEALASHCAGCEQIGWDVASTRTVKLGSERSDNVAVRGATENVFQISSINIESGRIFSEYEAVHSRPVCVVGVDIVSNLFPTTGPIKAKASPSTEIRLEDYRVSERYGSIFGFSRDNFVMIPFNTYKKNIRRASVSVGLRIRKRPGSNRGVEQGSPKHHAHATAKDFSRRR